MNQIRIKMQEMRAQQLVRGIRAAAILGFLIVASSLVRAWMVGWHGIMYLNIMLYLVIFATALLDRYLTFKAKAYILIGTSFILGIISLVVWGFGAFSLPSLFCFCVLATIFFGYRGGIVACAISVGAVAVTGACVYSGILVFNYNAGVHLNSPVTWLVITIQTASLAGILVAILGTLNGQMEHLVYTLKGQNDELTAKNKALQLEIAERIRAEEERQRLEKRLQAAEKMEMVGTLAGGVAHDLNNILGSVVGYPDLLLEELPADSPLRETLQVIKKSGIKAAAIVNDMLSLARRRIDITAVTNLNVIINEYLHSPEYEMLKRYHPAIDVQMRTDPDLKNIRGLTHQLSKVLMNLVSNAAEAMPDGGKVLISTENCAVEEPVLGYEEIPEGSYALLRVTDSGIGIPAEDLRRIFEPFYSKKKMGRSGTGLGMSVVWGTVKDHSGFIDVRSAESEGTTFALYFPSTMQPMESIEPRTTKTDLHGSGESILIVDDVKEQREIACKIFQTLGYRVHALGSGEEAVEYLKHAPVDLLVLDMHMEPGIDGLETYRRISRIRPGQNAIIITGFAETEQMREALGEGIGCFVKKPYLPEDIGFAAKMQLEKLQQRTKLSTPNYWN